MTEPKQPPIKVSVDIMSEEFDNVIGRQEIVNQTFDYMSTDRQYGIRDPKTKLLTIAGSIHGPGHVESCEELGPEWHYHSSKPENQPVYRYNSVGHRNAFDLKDLPDRKFGIAFGCSISEGIGLKEETIYHQEISKRIDLPIYNCAIGAASNDVSYWNFTQIMRRYKPAVVLYQLTSSDRFLLHHDNKIFFTTGQPKPVLKKELNENVLEFVVLANKLNYGRLRTQLQMEAIKTICKVTNTKLVFLEAFKDFKLTNFKQVEYPHGLTPDELLVPIGKDFGWVDFERLSAIEDPTKAAAARDRWHIGIKSHNTVADRVMEFLNNGQPFANWA